jgi:hypothetical protein
MNFSVDISYVDPKKYLSLQQYINQRTIEISRVANLVERRRQTVQFQIEVAKRQQDLYKNMPTKEVKLQGVEEVKVRTKVLPVNYDEKGKPKKYTKKELAELKGPNKKLPGYTAEWSNLNKGQVVQVYLAKKKTKTKVKKKKDKEEDDELFDDKDRPKVVMIVILQEPPMPK